MSLSICRHCSLVIVCEFILPQHPIVFPFLSPLILLKERRYLYTSENLFEFFRPQASKQIARVSEKLFSQPNCLLLIRISDSSSVSTRHRLDTCLNELFLALRLPCLLQPKKIPNEYFSLSVYVLTNHIDFDASLKSPADSSSLANLFNHFPDPELRF